MRQYCEFVIDHLHPTKKKRKKKEKKKRWHWHLHNARE